MRTAHSNTGKSCCGFHETVRQRPLALPATSRIVDSGGWYTRHDYVDGPAGLPTCFPLLLKEFVDRSMGCLRVRGVISTISRPEHTIRGWLAARLVRSTLLNHPSARSRSLHQSLPLTGCSRGRVDNTCGHQASDTDTATTSTNPVTRTSCLGPATACNKLLLCNRQTDLLVSPPQVLENRNSEETTTQRASGCFSRSLVGPWNAAAAGSGQGFRR
ncbi:hypothetical protein IWZ00DRAFT_228228 [Phyllosticta capitalensis]